MSLQSAAMRHGCNSPCVRICIVLLIACQLGCAHKNVPLNAGYVPLEKRALNHTRARTVLDAAEATTQPPRNRTVYFIDIAISGVASRSANFSHPRLFQLNAIGPLP